MNWTVSQYVQFYTCADFCQAFSNTHLDKRFSGGNWTVHEHELSYSLLAHSQNLLSCINSVHFISVGVQVKTRGFTAQLLPHGFRNITDIECVRWVFSSLEEIHHDIRNQLWLWCLCTASTPSGTWRPKGRLWDFVKNGVRILIGHLMRKKYLNSQRTRDRKYICGLMFKLMCKLVCKLKTCWSQVLS